MPLPNLQGLNIIHPPPPSDGDASDLLSSPHFPDLSAQLDLWSTLAFQSDDPITLNDPEDFSKDTQTGSDDLNDDFNPSDSTSAHDAHDAHAMDGVTFPASSQQLNNLDLPTQPTFDIDNFLSSFKTANSPFSATPTSSLLLGSSIAQLLALQSAGFTPFQVPPVADNAVRQNETPAHSPSKRPRTRETSESTVDEFESRPNLTPLTAAEDKRRRNTAASARFRLKKKEREAALETKAKELELKVTELERECEALRRENGWLKGLVVGVTGAAKQPAALKMTTTALLTTTKDESQGK